MSGQKTINLSMFLVVQIGLSGCLMESDHAMTTPDGPATPTSICDLIQVDAQGQRYISIADYTAFKPQVPKTWAEWESRFDTCDHPEHDFRTCWGTRYRGCGYLQYEPWYDESQYSLYSFNQETGKLVGVVHSSDTRDWCGDSTTHRIGHMGQRLTGRDTQCASVQKTYCCPSRIVP